MDENLVLRVVMFVVMGLSAEACRDSGGLGPEDYANRVIGRGKIVRVLTRPQPYCPQGGNRVPTVVAKVNDRYLSICGNDDYAAVGDVVVVGRDPNYGNGYYYIDTNETLRGRMETR